jgi:hypothetical protein
MPTVLTSFESFQKEIVKPSFAELKLKFFKVIPSTGVMPSTGFSPGDGGGGGVDEEDDFSDAAGFPISCVWTGLVISVDVSIIEQRIKAMMNFEVGAFWFFKRKFTLVSGIDDLWMPLVKDL